MRCAHLRATSASSIQQKSLSRVRPIGGENLAGSEAAGRPIAEDAKCQFGCDLKYL